MYYGFAYLRLHVYDELMVVGGNDDCKPHEWKKLCSKELGIKTSRITKPAKVVLNVLRKKGRLFFLVFFICFIKSVIC